jgi:hypothetical protein
MKKLVVNVAIAAGLAVLSLPSFAVTPVAEPQHHQYAHHHAHHNNYYIGAGFNHNSTFKEHHADDNFESDSSVIKLDDNDWGWNVFVGQRKDHFAHEAGINKIGGVMYDIYQSSTPSYLSQADNISVTKHDLFEMKDVYHFYYDGYLFKQVADGFELFVKFGISYLQAEGNRIAVNSTPVLSTGDVGINTPHNMYESGLSTLALNYGVGIQYDWKQVGIRAQYTHIAPTKDVENWNRIVDFVSIDGIYHID